MTASTRASEASRLSVTARRVRRIGRSDLADLGPGRAAQAVTHPSAAVLGASLCNSAAAGAIARATIVLAKGAIVDWAFSGHRPSGSGLRVELIPTGRATPPGTRTHHQLRTWSERIPALR